MEERVEEEEERHGAEEGWIEDRDQQHDVG
jgi:hypothetical protein